MTIDFSQKRDFKGIWIPKEIWLAEGLSSQEKCLWAEIHSLYSQEKGGCFASNEYLADFIGVKERRLQEMISNLKQRGFVIQVSFDGRERVLKAILSPGDLDAPQRCRKVHPSDAEKCTPGVSFSAPTHIYREKNREKNRTVPPEGVTNEGAAAHKQINQEALQIAKHLWKRIIAIHPNAKSPKLESWAQEIERAHRIDKRSYEDLRRVIDYAFDQDSFWVKVLQSADGLRRNFDKIWVKMTPVSNAGINAQKNTALAREAQAQLKASGSEKSKQFFITDGVLIRLDTGDRISLSLEPSSFEQEMIRIFALRKYE